MKHIKGYKIFESKPPVQMETWDPAVHPKLIESDPKISKWLNEFKTIDFGYPENEEPSSIQTPYGETIKVVLTQDDYPEYTGDGDWSDTASGYDEHKSEILYITSGSAKGSGNDLSDAEWEWDEDIAATIGYKSFDPIKFMLMFIEKDVPICGRMYLLLPNDKKEEIRNVLKDKGIDIERISRAQKIIL